MNSSNPLRQASHVIPLAAISLLLLSAGMCQPADEGPATGVVERQDEEQAARQAEAAAEAARAAAEAAELERRAAIAAAEQELAEREARLAAEEERLRRERELEAERRSLAAELAEAAERERQLAARERQLRDQEAELARREREVTEAETIVVEPTPPDPLPEPTGSYEGDFDEAWRQSQAPPEPGPEETVTGAGDGSGWMGAEPQAPAPEVAPVVASVQAGERLEVQIIDTLSSDTARTGDVVSARLVSDLRDAGGAVVIPAGAEVLGRITEATPYRRGSGPATLGVEFTEVVVSPQQTVGIRASFAELGADRSKNRKKVVAGAVIGAILGHVLGGDGSKNVIVGAAAGAAAGGAVVARSRDRDAEIPAGQIITLQLEEVVTVEIEYGSRAGG